MAEELSGTARLAVASLGPVGLKVLPVLAYDNARQLMAAIKSAGSTKPQAVRKVLTATHDFAGVTGTISYRGGSRIPAKSVSVFAVKEGRQSLAASVLPQEIPAP